MAKPIYIAVVELTNINFVVQSCKLKLAVAGHASVDPHASIPLASVLEWFDSKSSLLPFVVLSFKHISRHEVNSELPMHQSNGPLSCIDISFRVNELSFPMHLTVCIERTFVHRSVWLMLDYIATPGFFKTFVLTLVSNWLRKEVLAEFHTDNLWVVCGFHAILNIDISMRNGLVLIILILWRQCPVEFRCAEEVLLREQRLFFFFVIRETLLILYFYQWIIRFKLVWIFMKHAFRI